MDIEKLKRKREKHRLRIIKKLGNDRLKLCNGEQLKQALKLKKKTEEGYILGARRRWFGISKSMWDTDRVKDLVSYFELLPIVKLVELEEKFDDDENRYLITVEYLLEEK